jgi:hypothetical protein
VPAKFFSPLATDELARLAASWRHLSVEVNDVRVG